MRTLRALTATRTRALVAVGGTVFVAVLHMFTTWWALTAEAPTTVALLPSVLLLLWVTVLTVFKSRWERDNT